MPRHQLKISRDAHVIRCYGITKAKLKKLHYNSPIWRGIHAQLVKSNAEKKIKHNDSLIESYNQSTQAGAFRIPHGFLSDCINFSCGTCTLVFQKLSYLLQHECGGHAARSVHMARGSRQNLWLRCRQKEDQKAVKLLARHWKLSHQEINVLEKAGTDKKLPPLPAQVWQRDHTEDGDVEPNPGPSSCRHMHGITINVNGRENSWACARWICKEKPAIAILQEHCLLPDKQADLSRFMQAKGYRSWFVAPPASHSVLGHAYTSGGVAIFVRKDKGAREVNRHVAYDGQAIMLQLDHMFIIGAYLPPRNSQATQTLTVLDEWIASAGALEPVVILGDFNQEPELADRWTALADGGAAKVVSLPDGTRAPTRWEGNRCIDWIWSSHPFMVDELAFSEAVFSDHKALTFNLQYSQECVQSFKQVPTRSLLRPEQIPQKDWDKAMVKAWQQVPMPPNTTSEEEWNTFCSAVESSYDAAHQICSGSLSHGHTANVRAKGSPMKIKELEPAIFRLKQHASCRELKARKLLGRVREANVQQAAGASVPAVLLRRIWQHPLVRGKNFVSLLDIEHWADQEIKTLVKQDRLEKLQEWRRKMRNNMSHAREWVKRDNNLPVTSVHFEGYQDNTATSSNQQSLEAISQFWKTIWERDRPPVQEAFQFWQEGSEPMPEYAWSNLTPKELHRQAIRMKGSAGGADGITGSEAAQLPLRAWEILAELLTRWIARQDFPSVWQHTRQVHLQKPGAKLRTQDQAISAKDLRPISIQCTIWRIVSSAWTRRAATRRWILTWVHPTACGGIHGKGVARAVDMLFQKFEKGGVLLSLDFQKCFDTVDPELGILCLRHFGCPSPMLQMLKFVWQQSRWLTYNGEYMPGPIEVRTSLPQGDATSPLTLLALMTGITKIVLRREPQLFSLATFLDDRNMIARDPQQAFRLWQTWQEVSSRLGLWENDSKARVVPRRAAYEAQLVAQGFAQHHVTNAARVLGIDFTTRLGASDRKTSEERLRVTKSRLQRIAVLPVGMHLKAQHVASIAIPKAAWGCWTNLSQVRCLTSIVKRTAGSEHPQASTDLFYILAGHGLNAEFVAGMQAYLYLAAEVRKRARQWPRSPTRGTWLGTVRGWLEDLGWIEEGPFHWRCHALGARGIIRWSGRVSTAELDVEKHMLRESWRRILFANFLGSSRRDAQAIGTPPYAESRVAAARQLFREFDTHAKAVMMGAVVSDARLDRMYHRPIQPCSWCQHPSAIPCWDHAAWYCPAFSASRPRRPNDAFQRILGWPMGRNPGTDQAVLAHLGKVRQKLLDKRYRGIA